MRYLLDTHVWLWAAVAPEKLGRRTRKLLEEREAGLGISAVSVLELARLAATDRVVVDRPLGKWVRDSREALGLESVALEEAEALEAYALPGNFHRDPADRQLVATARVRGMTLVTADERILGYRYVISMDCHK